jgi:NADH dehydrogenase
VNNTAYTHRVVIVGGGFGGLYAAKRFRKVSAHVTLVDRRNFHLFQPLLYQVATGGLSPGDIASPLRAIFHSDKHIEVLKGEAVDIDPAQKKLILLDGELPYDTLIISTGVSHHYFGHDEWGKIAPGLKTIEDALEMRQRIFLAFEAAEREPDPQKRDAWMTFVVVGGGPTGVELAGALAELAHKTMRGDFRRIDPTRTRIILLEAIDRILPSYREELASDARYQLEDLGVTVRTGALVTGISNDTVTLKSGDQQEQIAARTVLWSAGVKASPMSQVLHTRLSAELDKSGRVIVAPDLSVPGHPDVFVIGDLAHYAHQGDSPLPGVATVAMQQGRYMAELVKKRLDGRSMPPFRYKDKGSMAVIGRNAAIADTGWLQLSGYPAWLIWAFIHINYLIEFDQKLMVMIQWAWNYFTRKRGARLITNESPALLPEKRKPARSR